MPNVWSHVPNCRGVTLWKWSCDGYKVNVYYLIYYFLLPLLVNIFFFLLTFDFFNRLRKNELFYLLILENYMNGLLFCRFWRRSIQGKSSQSTDSSILQITPHDRLYKFEHHLLPYYKLLQIIECTSLNITYYQIMTSKDRTVINNQKEKYIVQKKKRWQKFNHQPIC